MGWDRIYVVTLTALMLSGCLGAIALVSNMPSGGREALIAITVLFGTRWGEILAESR